MNNGRVVYNTKAINWVLRNSKSKHSARLVLISIACYTHKRSRVAWPSLHTLAKHCLLSSRQVIHAVKKLRGLGELRVEKRPAARRRGDSTNLYEIRGKW